jgi:hypothetical protein
MFNGSLYTASKRERQPPNRALTVAAIVVIKLQWHLVGDFRTFP